MTKGLLLSFALFVSANVASSQCINANDTYVNETIKGSTTHDLIEGSIRFSFELLRTLNDNLEDNEDAQGLFFSPHSIWSALMLTYMGARGATEEEMKNVLGIGDTDEMTTWEAFRNLSNFNKSEPTESKGASYKSANRIYFQEGMTINDCLKEQLDSDIAFLDFKDKPDESREDINKWVETQTQQRIKDLIPANAIDTLTRMVIANAIYFKETWQKRFGERTAPRKFTTPSGQEIFVNMMKTSGKFLYGKSEELQCYAIELPYTGNTLSMTILLPFNSSNGIDILTNNLTPVRLSNLLSDMYPREFMVFIPKFKMEESFELSVVLNKMGLRTLFNISRVDLSGFTGMREFTLDAVYHKTFINVNEEGTEAAAATAVKISRRKSKRRLPSFIADYPFVYFIRDNRSNAILFLGTLQKPHESANA